MQVILSGVCDVPNTSATKEFEGQKTLGNTGILTVYEPGPNGFSLVTAHKKDTDNLGAL